MKLNHSLKQKITDVAGIPKDVTMGSTILTIVGDIEINLENYGGIIEYTDDLIRIRIKNGQIIVKGNGLHIEYYTNYEMKIYGIIDSVEFRRQEG